MDVNKSNENYIYSALNDGLITRLLRIECSITRGFAGIQLLGNAQETCRDGKERAKAALESLGIYLPAQRLVISMTPGDLKKDGNHLDLPMALSMAFQVVKAPIWAIERTRWVFAAELGLSGELRPVKGIISFAIEAMATVNCLGIVVSQDNLRELQLLKQLKSTRTTSLNDLKDQGAAKDQNSFKVLGFTNLKEVMHWLITGDLNLRDQTHQVSDEGRSPEVPSLAGEPKALNGIVQGKADFDSVDSHEFNFDDMLLSEEQALAAMVTWAGMHSILLRGCPGTGKSMFAQRLTSLLPPMNCEEHVEVLRVYSQFSQKIPQRLLSGHPPFRAPHHEATAPAILGTPEFPGEMSLAHGGILFLDEFPEFRRDILESLREPLETGVIRVSRAKKKATWLCRVVLVAACNNCSCGWSGSARRACLCSTNRIQAYRSRLSGPVLGRIDLHLEFPETSRPISDLMTKWEQTAKVQKESKSTFSKQLRDRVMAAREFAAFRFKKNHGYGNGMLSACDVSEASGLNADQLQRTIAKSLPRGLTSRVLFRCLRVSRTLADLEGRPKIRAEDLIQSYRWQDEYAAYLRGEISHLS